MYKNGNDRISYNEYVKNRREKKRSTFKELDRYALSGDKSIVISLKSDPNITPDKISIAQAVKIVPEGKTQEVEIYYPHALTLSLVQAKEFLSILEKAVYSMENK